MCLPDFLLNQSISLSLRRKKKSASLFFKEEESLTLLDIMRGKKILTSNFQPKIKES